MNARQRERIDFYRALAQNRGGVLAPVEKRRIPPMNFADEFRRCRATDTNEEGSADA